MKARTKDYPAGPVQAFGGFEYVANEWRVVPPGFESQAEQHPYLEIEQEPEPEMSAMVEPVSKSEISYLVSDEFPGARALIDVGIVYLEDVPNSHDELVAIPGIGEATANKILKSL